MNDRRNELPPKFTPNERDAYQWLYGCGITGWIVSRVTKRVYADGGEYESLIAFKRAIEQEHGEDGCDRDDSEV